MVPINASVQLDTVDYLMGVVWSLTNVRIDVSTIVQKTQIVLIRWFFIQFFLYTLLQFWRIYISKRQLIARLMYALIRLLDSSNSERVKSRIEVKCIVFRHLSYWSIKIERICNHLKCHKICTYFTLAVFSFFITWIIKKMNLCGRSVRTLESVKMWRHYTSYVTSCCRLVTMGEHLDRMLCISCRPHSDSLTRFLIFFVQFPFWQKTTFEMIFQKRP